MNLYISAKKNHHKLFFFFKEKNKIKRVPVAHSCNPSYSGGRDQEDLSSRPAWANCSQDPISKNTQPKKGLVE
jgi:hypothetical protein